MASKHLSCLKACFLLVSISVVAFAQSPPGAAAPASGVRAELIQEIDDVETKLIKLAEAIPADKYTYRPGKDVRSVSEVFLHVVSVNFGIPRPLVVGPPADFQPQGFDKSTTEKTKVIDALKRSFTHVKQATSKLSDADLEKTLEGRGGQKVSYRAILLHLTVHAHEHLGQAIAYARTLGITPPWTEEQQQRQKVQQKPKS